MNDNGHTTDLLQKAWMFAAQRHQGQTYPATELPYLVHLGSVLLELGPALAVQPQLDSGLALCCAILHDTIEDTGTTRDEVERMFGQQVAEGVMALSKNPEIADKRAAMTDSLRRIRQCPKEVWLVKLSDRTANLGTPPVHWNAAKRRAYAEEGDLILSELGEASPLLAARLGERIAAWKAHEGV